MAKPVSLTYLTSLPIHGNAMKVDGHYHSGFVTTYQDFHAVSQSLAEEDARITAARPKLPEIPPTPRTVKRNLVPHGYWPKKKPADNGGIAATGAVMHDLSSDCGGIESGLPSTAVATPMPVSARQVSESLWWHPRSGCDETRYASRYQQLLGSSPYGQKRSRQRSGQQEVSTSYTYQVAVSPLPPARPQVSMSAQGSMTDTASMSARNRSGR
mmetsp:Transcript_35965/g.84251  ORF Transcript_35965/g.84251 Transcript_35965/m.84251 type:complete len:213 (-) Transcript_35965:134-772(-)